jgi:hypothetical protein
MVLVLLAAGCGGVEQYLYQPTTPNTTVSGLPAVDYPIPTGQPRGDVRVVSFGVVHLQPQSDAEEAHVLQVRLIVTNAADDAPWTIDTRQIVLGLEGEGQSRPALVNADAGSPPLLEIPRGQQRTIDAYYPLPPARANGEQLPAFDVVWQVQTGAGPVVQRTAFRREPVAGGAALGDASSGYPIDAVPFDDAWAGDAYWAGSGYGYGLGPLWWYDPLYPRFCFYHHPVFALGGGPLGPRVWASGGLGLGWGGYGHGYGYRYGRYGVGRYYGRAGLAGGYGTGHRGPYGAGAVLRGGGTPGYRRPYGSAPGGYRGYRGPGGGFRGPGGGGHFGGGGGHGGHR